MPESVTRWPPQWKVGLKCIAQPPINSSYTFNMTSCTGRKRSYTENIEAEPPYTHTHWKPQWHSLSLFLSLGRFPVNPPGLCNIQYMCCELSPRTDWTTRRLSADVTFKRCTPALSHSDKHRSKQGQPSPGPRLVNLDVDCSGISLFDSMARFLLFLCLYFRWEGLNSSVFFILRTACPL